MEKFKKNKLLISCGFCFVFASPHALSATFWGDDSIAFELYEARGELDYEYTGQNLSVENVQENENNEDNEGSNNESLLFPRTLGNYDYKTTMVGLHHNYFFNGKDFIRTRFGTNVTGDATINERNRIRNQDQDLNNMVTAFEIESETDDIRRFEMELMLGHSPGTKRSDKTFEMMFGLGYTNESFVTDNVQILQNNYDLPVDFEQGDYLKNSMQTFSLNLKFDYNTRLFQGVDFNLSGNLKPYVRYDGDFNYENRNDALQPFEANLKGIGWGASLQTGLNFHLSDSMSAIVFYRHDMTRIDGDAKLKFRNLDNIQRSSSQDLDEVKHIVNNVGLSLKYEY